MGIFVDDKNAGNGNVWDQLGIVWDYPGIVLGLFWDWLQRRNSLFWEYLGIIGTGLGIAIVVGIVILGTSWDSLGLAGNRAQQKV